MTIEFFCPECNKKLRAPDEAAGRRAKCNGCGKVVSVPQPESPPEDAISPPDDWDVPTAPAANSEVNPYATPRTGFEAPLAEDTPIGPLGSRRITANEAFNKTWKVYRANLLLTAVAIIVLVAVGALVGYGLGTVADSILAGFGNPVGPTVYLLMSIILNLIVNSFFAAGMAVFTLKGARARRPTFADIFAGGPYFTRFLLISLLYSIPVLPGQIVGAFSQAGNNPLSFSALAIGLAGLGGLIGVIMYVILAPLPYLIVDRDMSFKSALKLSEELTRGNRLSILVVMIAAGVYSALGVLLCGIGFLLTAPFGVFALTVTYLCLTGQPILNER